MPEARGGRPRDVQLDDVILAATRELLAAGSYAELSMEGVATRAKVGKKTVYRRWSSKAPLVADAVLDAYGRGSSFEVPNTGDLRADLRCWLVEHAEFIADPASAALVRALIAAAAASTLDSQALDQQLSVPQHAGLLARLRLAADGGQLRADADIDAVANALIGTLLLRLLSRTRATRPLTTEFDGLLDAILGGILR
ncbi:TetR/AcrR family transcriptional regulator [Mycobacterium seoulense]|uniref:TetR/AcrR family transcriptional regulator n=1 Tax=Mycobacterium seoulense TaxID=386911 RepID=UPI003CEE95F6